MVSGQKKLQWTAYRCCLMALGGGQKNQHFTKYYRNINQGSVNAKKNLESKPKTLRCEKGLFLRALSISGILKAWTFFLQNIHNFTKKFVSEKTAISIHSKYVAPITKRSYDFLLHLWTLLSNYKGRQTDF